MCLEFPVLSKKKGYTQDIQINMIIYLDSFRHNWGYISGLSNENQKH